VPGDKHWPPIPEPGGMAIFIDTWHPTCNDGVQINHGDMTLYADGGISYAGTRQPSLATRYRVIETTPHYVVVMAKEGPWRQYGEILRFAILQVEAGIPKTSMLWNECQPKPEDLAGFKWTDDDAALARVWAGAKSCNPKFSRPYETKPFWGTGQSWSLPACRFWRVEPEDKPGR
jgi:hypothetical protein